MSESDLKKVSFKLIPTCKSSAITYVQHCHHVMNSYVMKHLIAVRHLLLKDSSLKKKFFFNVNHVNHVNHVKVNHEDVNHSIFTIRLIPNINS